MLKVLGILVLLFFAPLAWPLSFLFVSRHDRAMRAAIDHAHDEVWQEHESRMRRAQGLGL